MGTAVIDKAPIVSVVMPVRNGVPYIDEAIRSICNQTFTDWELVVVDDGSTDGTLSLLAQWVQADPRIRVIQQEAQGLVAASNAAVGAVRGRYVARLDSDDIAHAKRLAWQVACMERHPKLLAIGSAIQLFGDRSGLLFTPLTNWGCRGRLLFENCFAHSSVMLRYSMIEHLKPLYELQTDFAEDFALWVRLAHLGNFANIPLPLVKYRVHPRQVSRENANTLQRKHADLSVLQWRRLGVEISVEEFQSFRWPNFLERGRFGVMKGSLRVMWAMRALLATRYAPQAACWMASICVRNMLKAFSSAARRYL
jgi:glycosyltransferase involved in cell wall biosynthesis